MRQVNKRRRFNIQGSQCSHTCRMCLREFSSPAQGPFCLLDALRHDRLRGSPLGALVQSQTSKMQRCSTRPTHSQGTLRQTLSFCAKATACQQPSSVTRFPYATNVQVHATPQRPEEETQGDLAGGHQNYNDDLQSIFAHAVFVPYFCTVQLEPGEQGGQLYSILGTSLQRVSDTCPEFV